MVDGERGDMDPVRRDPPMIDPGFATTVPRC